MPQRLDRIQPRRAPCREKPEQDADGGGKGEGDDDDFPVEHEGDVHGAGGKQGEAQASENADDAAEHGQHHRLHQELHQHPGRLGADGEPDADLPCALGDRRFSCRHWHDVQDADAADAQADAGDRARKRGHHGGGRGQRLSGRGDRGGCLEPAQLGFQGRDVPGGVQAFRIDMADIRRDRTD